MAYLHNKPRKLDYVHFTRVDNSVFASSTAATTNGAVTSTMGIVARLKMVAPQIMVTISVAAIVVTVIAALVVAVILTLALDGRRSDKGPADNKTNVVSIETSTTSSSSLVSTNYSISLTTSAFLWTSSDMSTHLTSTTSSTKSPSCPSSEFVCSSKECISIKLVCNGIPDCADGSDESSACACTSGQFQCPSGQCVTMSDVCNEVYDCLDKGDEANCPDCTGFRCQSNNVCLWDRMTSRCNQIFDCEDYSDEINCQRRIGQHVCSNKVQIHSTKVCDGLDDCGDNSDEENCVCQESRQFACSDHKGKCIPLTWVCDGHPDCPNRADEERCDSCSNKFQCADYTCVNMSLRCDGKVDCSVAGGDEHGCVEITSLNEAQVMVDGSMLPVCSEGWTDEYSTWVCSSLHTREVLSWTHEVPVHPVTKFAVIKDLLVQPNILNFRVSDACHSGTVIHIKCQDAGCGQRKMDVLESYVAGGSLAPLGKWPWVVSLAYLDKPVCGGVLINTRWALTAAHCVMYPLEGGLDYSNMPFYYTVTAGAVVIPSNYTRAGVHQLQPQVVRLAKIILHPRIVLLDSGGVDWDLALLLFESDIRMSDLVQPVCLPSQAQIFSPTSVCFLAGWGLLSFRQHMRSSQLRDTRMHLWSESRCSSNTVIGETTVNTNSTLCGGYLFGKPTGCQGDSGSPLVCQDSVSGHYLLAGVVSRGSDKCGRFYPYTHGNRFARVAMTVNWIQETMAGHQPL